METGQSKATLAGHTAEIVSLGFNTPGDLVVTGSFDHDSRIWDVRTGSCVHVLSGHRGEVSSAQFNYSGARHMEEVGQAAVYREDMGVQLACQRVAEAAVGPCSTH